MGARRAARAPWAYVQSVAWRAATYQCSCRRTRAHAPSCRHVRRNAATPTPHAPSHARAPPVRPAHRIRRLHPHLCLHVHRMRSHVHRPHCSARVSAQLPRHPPPPPRALLLPPPRAPSRLRHPQRAAVQRGLQRGQERAPQRSDGHPAVQRRHLHRRAVRRLYLQPQRRPRHLGACCATPLSSHRQGGAHNRTKRIRAMCRAS